MANDPLTSIPEMIAFIEPGPRLIDGLLLQKLYILVGDAATAASIEPGWRMIDEALLRKLADAIGAINTAQRFQEVGPRLLDGSWWKPLSQMAAGQITPLMGGVGYYADSQNEEGVQEIARVGDSTSTTRARDDNGTGASFDSGANSNNRTNSRTNSNSRTRSREEG